MKRIRGQSMRTSLSSYSVHIYRGPGNHKVLEIKADQESIYFNSDELRKLHEIIVTEFPELMQ